MIAKHRIVALGLCAVVGLGLVPGCAKPDPNSPVELARQRGRDHAFQRDYKLASDCGSLKDLDERHGCAEWVNARDD